MSAPELKVALVGLNWPGYQSLALAYVRAYAEAQRALAGRAAFLTLDLEVGTEPWWLAYRLLRLEPDVVGFSVTCWNAQAVYEAARVLRLARPQTRIVLGGPEVSTIAEEVLRAHPHVTAIVRGEGERTFSQLLEAFLAGEDPWTVAGVSAIDGEEVRSSPDRDLIKDLDEIPSPYLSGVLAPIDGGTYLETYRGCPHKCGYCFEGKGYGRVRSFSEERIRAEIDLVAGTPGVTNFSFIDPVFNLTSDRLRMLADALEPHAGRGVRLHTVEVDIERIDDGVAAELARAGVASVETGPQTIGAQALEAVHRGFDAERFRAGVSALRALGIRVECDLIVGLPGDDAWDFVAGLEFALSLDPGRVQSSTLHVLPGTALWDDAESIGLAFDREPPHILVSSPKAPYVDLRRCEVLGAWVQAEYEARL